MSLFSLTQRRRIAALVLYTFGIDAAAPMSIFLTRATVAVATVASSAAPASAQSASLCDAALNAGSAPVASAATARLWPPNHALSNVLYSADLRAACSGIASLRVRVWADEPDEDQTGDGNHSPDAVANSVPELLLRAERKGNGDGRVYLILATATSPSGVSNTACSAVGVAKSQSKKDRDSLDAQIAAALFYCAANDAPPAEFFPLLDTPWGAVVTNQAPQVSAGPDATIAFGASVALVGTATDDGLPSNTLTAQWTVVSGPGAVTIANSVALVTSATFSSSGAYVLRLTATDGVLSSSDDMAVVVGLQNTPPVVSAGPDVSVTLPATTATLSGSVTDDGLPSGTLGISWTVVSGGPGGVTFSSPSAATTDATFSTEGTYVLRLSATDGALSASDDVQVVVHPPANAPPTVSAGPDASLVLPASVAALAGSVSDDGQPTGTLTTLWTQVSGPSGALIADPSAPITAVTITSVGAYVFRLTADDDVLAASDDMTLSVSPAPNLAPVANAGPDLEIQLPSTTASLVGSVSDDGQPAGTLVASWTVISGPGVVTFSDPSAAATSVTIETAGAYVLRLTASDSVLTASDDAAVTVLPAPAPSVSIDDLSAAEGNDGRRAITTMVRLSRADTAEVRTDYVTAPGNAREGCDYEVAYGTLTFAPGVTELPLTIYVNGDLAPEADETFEIRLGNAFNAVLADAAALVTLQNDDGINAPPSRPSDRTPSADAIEQPLSTTLQWAPSTDPDSDPVTYDVEFAASFDLTGQQWTAACAATSGPGARSGAATAYDDGSDRLFVFGGTTGAADLSDLWILSRASEAGGTPVWASLSVAFGPGDRRLARAAYDSITDRLLVVGGCAGACDAPFADAWLLDGVSSASPSWVAVPDLPAGRANAAAAFDESTGRFFLVGGLSPSGLMADVVHIDMRAASPAWETAAPTGLAPAPFQGASAVYDSSTDRVVVFGGLNPSGASRDLVALTNPTGSAAWVALAPAGSQPAGRHGHAFHYDPVTDRAVLYGGTTAGVAANTNFVASDTWVLSGVRTLTPIWERLTAAAAPTGRFDASTGLSVSENRLVVALGANNKIGVPALDDSAILANALGSIQTVASGQATTGYAPALAQNATYYWRVIARDDKGAIAGARPYVFSIGLPSLRAVELSVLEGDTGVVTASVPVLLSRPSADTVTVAFDVTAASGAGSATAGVDFTPVSGVLVFLPGETVKSIDVPIISDLVFESDETVRIALTAPSGAALAEASTLLTIQNDDAPNTPPVVSAGADILLTPPTLTTTLNGSATDDGVALPLSLTWTQLAGPGSTTFTDATAAVTSVTLSAPGDYVFRLTADDGLELVSDDVSVFARSRADLTTTALDATGVTYDAASLAILGSALVTVADLSGVGQPLPFDVTVFEDRDGNGRFEVATDILLGRSTVAGLAASATVVVAVPLSGNVLFAGNIIHAAVDALGVVAETNEANNTISTAPPCTPGTVGTFSPVLERSWTGSTIEPTKKSVIMTPAVADLTGDGIPEIIFISHPAANFSGSNGVLRAIDGASGAEVFTNAAVLLEGIAHIAVGDIDGDARPEIVAAARGQRLVAFEHDGTLKWTSPVLSGNLIYGAPVIAQLDGIGPPEIVMGNHVLNADGTLRWTGAGGRGEYLNLGGISVVADIDGDGSPEVMAGNTAYRADGTILWRNTSIPDGYVAIANMDADPEPEIVHVTSGQLRILSATGAVELGPVTIPGGRGGPPTVADMDGDGKPEIGVASFSRYTVWEDTLATRWSVVISDVSSGITGSSVFDFDGDGRAEVVYGDEFNLRVFRGTDGVVLFQTPLRNATGTETALVADVDGDQNAEIVAVANLTLGGVGAEGIFIYGDANDSWVSTRKVWNQHSYHVGNVNDDLSIPAVEIPSWTTHNSYRSQVLPEGGCAFVRPDLAPSFARKSADPAGLSVTLRIGNAGAAVVPAGASISFRNGSAAGPRLATLVTATAIPVGAFVDLTTVLPLGVSALPLFVVADDPLPGGTSNVESNEANNALDTRIYWGGAINAVPQVDAGADQTLTDTETLATLTATVTDDGLPGPPAMISWGLVSGPASASIGMPSQATTEVTLIEAGAYVFRVTAFDFDLSASDEVTIVKTSPNTPPLVGAGADQAIVTGNTVLNGAAVDDGLPLPTSLTFQWVQTAGPAATIDAPTFASTGVALPAN
ncbi:MAG: hypothetical protein JJE39_11890, partial [Vicinamibacteria bacterium]|nr:hypothetical protein [Vicinamibacteria bacterium]